MNRAISAAKPAKEELCPVCGSKESGNWLRTSDRFHGRREIYQLLQCPSCSMVWQKDPPAPDQMHSHYGSEYDRLITSAGESSPERWHGRREALSRYKTGGALLDLGCSSGAFLETLKGSSWKLHGIEMSEVAARKAEERTGAQIFVGDILEAPYSPASFDVITCFDVLEHVYEPRKVLAKVQEWLKPGGVFYVLIPNIYSAEARLFGSYWYGLELPRHISHFSPASLRRVAMSVGLEEVDLQTHRNSALGYSVRYIVDEAFHRLGLSRQPLATAKPPSIPRRVFRKLFRVSVQPVLLNMISLLGPGESIHAVFRNGAAELQR
jgi:SAM-dependent methyltransferase